jgi:hypothetical protein
MYDNLNLRNRADCAVNPNPIKQGSQCQTPNNR